MYCYTRQNKLNPTANQQDTSAKIDMQSAHFVYMRFDFNRRQTPGSGAIALEADDSCQECSVLLVQYWFQSCGAV
jgi:hypothetical protein